MAREGRAEALVRWVAGLEIETESRDGVVEGSTPWFVVESIVGVRELDIM